MYERFTDLARRVLQLANEEALQYRHEYVGTEHLLLGLVKTETGVAADVLRRLGVDLRRVSSEVASIVQPGPTPVKPGTLPQTPRTKKAVEYAIEEERKLKHEYVGTEHLLLGLLREEEGVGAQVLMNLGVGLRDARNEVLKVLGEPQTGIVDLSRRPTHDVRADIQDLPDHARKIALEFDWHIEQLRREKEKAIDNQDFKRAATLTEQEGKLVSQRAIFVAEWRCEEFFGFQPDR